MSGGVSRAIVEEIARREIPQVMATLARLSSDLELAEDAAQEALLSALTHWPMSGLPERPGAWLMTAARNALRERFRTLQTHARYEGELAQREELRQSASEGEKGAFGDDLLRLIFTCCHPALPAESQVALTLRLLMGFSPASIARAFLTSESAIDQRLVRAKKLLRDAKVPYGIPGGTELGERLPTVLAVLYAIFNEGICRLQGMP